MVALLPLAGSIYRCILNRFIQVMFAGYIHVKACGPRFLYLFLVAGLIFLPSLLAAREQPDTIREISGVDVRAGRIFLKESAGMKESGVDSLVFARKVNLSLSCLLSENTPVFIRSHGRGALATASFRGTAPSHTRVSWNGIVINSPMAGMVDFSLIPVYVIDEVSLRHGSASISDGTGGLGGSIGISNRADWDNTFRAGFMQGIGSYGTFDEYLDLALGNRKIQLRTRLYHNQSENNYPFVNRGIGTLENGVITHPVDTNRNASYHLYGVLQELYFQPSAGHIVSVKWWGQQAGRSIPQATSYEGPDHSNLNRQADTDHRVVADWNHYTSSGKWLARSGYSRKLLVYRLDNRVQGLGVVPAIYSESTQHSYTNHAAYSLNLHERLSLQAGIDADYHQVVSTDTVTGTGYNKSRPEYSMLVSGHYNPWPRLNVNLSIRQDLIQGRFSPLMPFAGLDFRILSEPGLIFKANVARNHHHPTMNDLYWQPGGNPELLPEEGVSMEAGLQYQHTGRRAVFEAEVTAYRADISNWIIWIPGFKGYWEPMNISRVLSRGLEVSTRAETRVGGATVRALATYAYTRSTNLGDARVWGDESYGKQLVYIPVHSGNLFVNIGYKGFYVGWQHNSFSERFTTSSNDVSRRDWLYPYFMNDLSLGKGIVRGRFRVDAELKILNLFDETYHTVLYRPMPGRHFMITLKTGFSAGSD